MGGETYDISGGLYEKVKLLTTVNPLRIIDGVYEPTPYCENRFTSEAMQVMRLSLTLLTLAH